MNLWQQKPVPSSLPGIPLHLLPNSRKLLQSFRTWWIIPTHGKKWEIRFSCVNYKVCDEGIYTIYDSDKRLIKRKRGYVPEIFGQDNANFGDYVSMSIDCEGRIQNWKVTDMMLENLLS